MAEDSGGIKWGGKTFKTKAAFSAWLKTHGSSWKQWAKNHPDAAARFTGGGNTGGNQTDPTTQTQQFDWRAWLEDWGFPPDVAAQLDAIFRANPDPATAAQLALAYIRGTPWYAQTFPGIEFGKKVGLFGDERGYRAYVSQVNDSYIRFYGRGVTNDELVNLMKSGYDPLRAERNLEGGAYVNAYGNDTQFTLGAFGDTGRASDADLLAFGQQQAGVSSSLGMQVTRRVAQASQRLERIFSGTLATGTLSFRDGRLAAPSLVGTPENDLQR